MKKEDLTEALEAIVEAQDECAPVSLRIGTTRDGLVQHGTLSVTDAPALVLTSLYAKGFSLSVSDGELAVERW